MRNIFKKMEYNPISTEVGFSMNINQLKEEGYIGFIQTDKNLYLFYPNELEDFLKMKELFYNDQSEKFLISFISLNNEK